MSTTLRNNGCGEASTNGVIYYKLTPGYSGATTKDITKNCGLVGNEIDSNFHFLRGYDIETIGFNSASGTMIFNRVNGENITVPVQPGSSVQDMTFAFDQINSELVVTYPDGSIVRVSGFTSGGISDFATDNTILGNGHQNNPLRLNPIEMTGTYAPADIYIDLTEEGSTLPEASKGYRIVTKEYSNVFGRLYSYDAVMDIAAALTAEGNGWRIPSKKDFDDLLNYFECEEYKNHSATTLGVLGQAAGQVLKSTHYWKENNTSISSNSTQGLDTVGMTIYPTGNDEDDRGAEEFGSLASIWTNSKYNDELVYVKKFKYNSNAVTQDAIGIHGKYNSIRLVKDYDLNNYNEIDYILGLTYPTVMIRDERGIKIWTKINFYDSNEQYDSINVNFEGITTQGGFDHNAFSDDFFKSEISSAQTVFYVNEWNGEKWVKKQMREGDSVVILTKDDTEYREWRLKFGELYDIFGEDFNVELGDLRQSILNLSSATISFSASVVNNISALTQTIVNNYNELSDVIEDKYDELAERIDELSANTKTFGDGLQESGNVVSIKIDHEDEGYLYVDENGLRTDGIDDAIEAAKNEVINTLSSAITIEISGATEDAKKYEIFSNDIDIQRTSTGRTLTILIDNTLRKIQGSTSADTSILGSAIRVRKDGNEFFLVDRNGTALPDSDTIALSDNGTIKQIIQGRDNYTNEGGRIIEGTDNGVPALCILYKDTEGNYQLSKTSLDDLLSDKYAGLGIEIKSLSDNGYKKIMAKLHPNQEYLGVDENGLFVSGITEYIDSKIEEAMTTIREEISAYTENALNEFYNMLITSAIPNTIKNYLVGTDYEIKLTETIDNKLRIGFTNNALFGVEKEFMAP